MALGAAAARSGTQDKVIAVIGDGASGCGVTFEAFNCAKECDGSKKLIVILNDNQMSISRNVGALTAHLSKILSGSAYNKFRSGLKNLFRSMPRITRFFSWANDVFKSALLPPGMFFEALGFRYFGPVSGHDLPLLISTLEHIRRLDGPMILHVVTEKGRGCEYAAGNPVRYHGISGCDEKTGEMAEKLPGFSEEFGKAMVKIAGEDENLLAVSAAMLEGTGLAEFAYRYPERTCDVGIAEEHAVTFAAGMAAGGKRPVCAIYDTFLQRALDNIYHDAALASLPLVIVSDRAGAVEDGPTHHGIYNCGFLRAIPNLTVMSPVNCNDVENCLRYALKLNSPVVIRYPRGRNVDERIAPAGFERGKARIIRQGNPADPVLWGFGAEVSTALSAAEILAGHGLDCTVVDTVFLKPFDKELAAKFTGCRQYTVEDHSVTGGLFSALAEALADKTHAGVKAFGWSDDEVIPHGKTDCLRDKYELTAEKIARKILLEEEKAGDTAKK